MKKYMRNKVLPMLMALVMVIGLLPVMGGTAKAATASTVYVCGKKLNEGGRYTLSNGGYADFSNGTLTLNNFQYKGADAFDSEGIYIIIYITGDLKIKLIGNNTIESTITKPNTKDIQYGIQAPSGSITIEGPGTLNVTLPDMDTSGSNDRNDARYAILCSNLTIRDTTVNLTCGTNSKTYTNAEGGASNFAISTGNLSIENSSVTATASCGYFSYGINASNIEINRSTVESVSGHGDVANYGVYSSGSVTITESYVIATGSKAISSNNRNQKVYGIYATDELKLNSGFLEMTSGGYSNPDGAGAGAFSAGSVTQSNLGNTGAWEIKAGTDASSASDKTSLTTSIGTGNMYVKAASKHTVTINDAEYGTCTVKVGETPINSGDKVYCCETVTVTTTPNSGCGFKSFSVKDSQGQDVTVSSNGNTHTFTLLGDVTITPEFECYAPLFDPRNGKPLILGGGDFEAGYTAPEAPTHADGYTFAGWYTQPNGGGHEVDGYTAGTTYYAHWTKNGHTVYTTGLDFTEAESVPEPTNGFTWNKDTKTLTLSGLYVDSLDYYGLKLPDGATVNLTGTENFIAGGNSVGDTYGIYSDGAYTLNGTGKLAVIAGDSTGGHSCGLSGTVTQNGGSVTVTSGAVSGDGYTSTAVKKLTLNGGTMEATGGKATGNNGGSYGALHVTLNGGTVTATGGSVVSGTSCGANEVTVGAGGLLTAVAGEAATQKGIAEVNPGSANPGVYFSESGDERDLTNFSYEASDSISEPNNLAKITFAPALDLSGTKSFEYTAGKNTPTITVTPARWKDGAGNPVTEIGETVYRLYKIETNGTVTPVANKSGAVTYSDQGVGSITDLDISGLTPGDYVLKVITADPTDSSKQLEGGMKLSIAKKEFDGDTIDFEFDFGADDATISTPVYNGNAYTPDVIIKDGAYQLEEDKDYELSYTNNTDAGTASVTITFKGNYSSDAPIVKDFTIAPMTLNKENMTSTLVPVLDGDELRFTGGIKWGDIELEEGDNKDYKVVVTGNLEDPSVADISIVFMGNYQNETVGEALVLENQAVRTLLKEDMFAFEISDIVYTGSEIKPTVTTSNENFVEGTHYTVSYENNVGAGEGKIIITGITENGFSGTVEKTFTIAKAEQAAPDVAKLTVVAESVKNKGDGSISGVTDKMEYRKVGGGEWKDITGTKLTGLEPGEYEIRYEEDDDHKEGSVTKVVISASDVTLTVKFDLNGASGEAIEKDGFAYGAKVTSEPSEPTRENYTFLGWTLKDGTAWVFGSEGSAVTDNITLYAKWVKTGFTVSGMVFTDADKTIGAANAKVKVVQGNLVYQSVDAGAGDDAGKYTLTNVPAGTYNLVVTHGGKTVTVLMVVDADAKVEEIVLPTEKVSSKVDIAPGTPNIMVGDLDKQANAAMLAEKAKPGNNSATIAVTVDMKVEAKVSEEVEENAKNQIVGEAGVQSNNLSFVDIDITQTTTINGNSSTAAVTETDDVLKIIIPFVTAGRKDFTVYRYHVVNDVGTVHELTITPDESTGEYIEVGNGEIIVHAKFFSTYAIGYTVGSNNNNSSNNKPDNSRPSGGIYVPPVKPAEPVSYDKCKHDGACPLNEFTDLRPDAWYHDAVHYCIDNGIMNGYGKDFRAEGAVTRQQVWMMLARLSGETPANMAAARTWAMANGVSDGTNPTNAVTRQQFITMLWRYAKQNGYDVSAGEDTNILSYTDAFDIAEYAYPAMQWGCAESIMGGYNDGSLKPGNGATRAHVAAFLQRFCVGSAKN